MPIWSLLGSLVDRRGLVGVGGWPALTSVTFPGGFTAARSAHALDAYISRGL